ncbi:hypothetical protein COF68_04740 [Bacillus toyonensis]|uniref:hypothetical protein n=1 Tax=Bacillus toyonensis TaxID=155322 RepID=UPI000BFD83B5|nr:hypothetical protein [Bacillus toyonensis]PHE64158.1 hypothetical protein COF68_04740 [Bacillus toyonensis]
MTKEELIEEIKISLPSPELLHVVTFAGIELSDRVVVLKSKPDFRYTDDFKNQWVKYSKPYHGEHSTKELLKKNVVFTSEVLNKRGNDALCKLEELLK